MAKIQTFTSKLGKDKKNFKLVKYIQTLLSEKTGHIKFLSRMVRMEENENIDQALKREEEESSNVLAFGEQLEEAPAEEPVEEAPAEEEATAEETEEGTTLGGEKLPVFNKKFKTPSSEQNFTRTTFMLVDTGTLPSGDNKEQVDKNEEPNFEAQTVLNQGIRRYNQMFSQQMTITIGGDFSLHAGDSIFVDTPSVKAETDEEKNKETGGKYIIADLCHYVTSKETYTKLNVVRDSFGRVAEN